MSDPAREKARQFGIWLLSLSSTQCAAGLPVDPYAVASTLVECGIDLALPSAVQRWAQDQDYQALASACREHGSRECQRIADLLDGIRAAPTSPSAAPPS